MINLFILNVSLLVSATVLYTIIIRRWKKGSHLYALLSGLLFGVVAVLGMIMPVVLEPGIIFDSRSIIHSIAGLFGGPYTAFVALIISSLYRLMIGGSGTVVGIFTIIQASAFGVLFHYLIIHKRLNLSTQNLVIFSTLVNLVMLISFTFVPGMTFRLVLNQLALPIIVIYPITTLIIAYIIISEEKQIETEKELLEKERRLIKTQELAHIGSWEYKVVNDQLQWSDEVYRIFGVDDSNYKPSYAAFFSFIHPEDRELVDTLYKESVLAGEDSYDIEHRIVRQNSGEVRYVHERCEHYKNSSGQIVRSIGMVQDITERKDYEIKLQFMSIHDQLTGLYNRYYFEEQLHCYSKSRQFPISILSADLDGLKLINDTMGHARGDQLLIECANVLRKSLRNCDVLARIGGDEFAAILPTADAAIGEKICNRVRQNLAELVQNDMRLPLSMSLGLATSFCPEENTLIELLKKADDLMYRDKLYHSKSKRNEIVQALMTALAERDFIAEGHAERVQQLSYKMGVQLGLTSRQLADLALLGQVHDLGKVGIPDHILFKPETLSEEEWDIMKMHPEKGYRIASSSPDLANIAEFILKHHEHWDGSGYPLGLKGKEIPIECRILGIVDAFDAMTSERPYSNAMDEKAATAELKRCAGSQFDPALVEVFIAIFDDNCVKG